MVVPGGEAVSYERGTPVHVHMDGREESSTTETCVCTSALEATQGQMDGFFSQLPYKCNLEEVASVGDYVYICIYIYIQIYIYIVIYIYIYIYIYITIYINTYI